MKQNRLFNGLDSFFNIIYYLAKLNLFFWAYTVRGCVVLGFFPSLTALIEVVSIGDIQEVSVRVKKAYKESYRKHFYRANKLGAVLIISGLILFSNYLVMSSGQAEYSVFTVFGFFTILILFFILAVWAIPLIHVCDLSLRKLLKLSAIMGVTQLHFTLAAWTSLFILSYLSLAFPAMIVFFTFSSAAFVLTALMRSMSAKVEGVAGKLMTAEKHIV